MRGKEAGHFREVAGVSIVAAGSPCSVVDTLNCGQPSGSTTDWYITVPIFLLSH